MSPRHFHFVALAGLISPVAGFGAFKTLLPFRVQSSPLSGGLPGTMMPALFLHALTQVILKSPSVHGLFRNRKIQFQETGNGLGRRPDCCSAFEHLHGQVVVLLVEAGSQFLFLDARESCQHAGLFRFGEDEIGMRVEDLVLLADTGRSGADRELNKCFSGEAIRLRKPLPKKILPAEAMMVRVAPGLHR